MNTPANLKLYKRDSNSGGTWVDPGEPFTLREVNTDLNTAFARFSKGIYFLELRSQSEKFIERIILK